MKFGSVCSGIEAASVAWNPLGLEAAWFSEIEKFPSAVLAHHYPDVPNLGDMTLLPERILSSEVEAPDILCGGTPCQAFSVAGNRKSLDDARGNLTLTFCEIADAIDTVRIRNNDKPAILFWENVPGVLNTKDNAFGCFLGQLAGEDLPLEPAGKKWTNAGVVLGSKRAVAWRVLDAQYFGVAQRRRRVFVVASAREGFCPAEVLFESEGLRRDIAPSRKTGEEFASDASRGFDKQRIGEYSDNNIGSTIAARDYKDATDLVVHPTYGIPGNWINRKPENGGNAVEPMHDVAPCLTKTDQHGVVHPIKSFGMDLSQKAEGITYREELASTICGMNHAGHGSHVLTMGDVAGPLDASYYKGQGSRQGGEREFVGVVYGLQGSMIGRCDTAGPQGSGISENISFTLTKADQHAVAFGGNIARTLQARHDSSPCADRGMDVIAVDMAVRRLTPTECERLQGFPDSYTKIPWRGKPAQECPDGPRYKALGNSWAVPVVRWIGSRMINEVQK